MKQIYFIRPVGRRGPIKIGCSMYPEQRVKAMMMWCPDPLEIILRIPGDHALERNIHSCFYDCHDHNEWFHPAPKLIAAIRAMQDGTPVERAIDLEARQGSIRSKASEAGWIVRRQRRAA